MKVYIAGPMRGYPRWNFDAFDRAEAVWKAAGHQAYSPAQIDRALGIDPNGPLEQIDGDFARRAIQLDIAVIYSADAIALLPGWERSSGATVELALAYYLRLKIYDAETLEEIEPDRHPWFSIATLEENTDAPNLSWRK